jgi:hypothetical protein
VGSRAAGSWEIKPGEDGDMPFTFSFQEVADALCEVNAKSGWTTKEMG